MTVDVEEEAHCYVVQCKRIVCGQYVADYSTECRTFRPEGLRQLRTKLRMYSVRLVYVAMGDCIPLNNLLRIAHKLFAYIEQRSNEPLLLHY